MQTSDGLVLKPVQSPPRGEREHNFFKRLFPEHNEAVNHSPNAVDTCIGKLNEDERDLRKLLPTYRGSFVHNDIVYIKMDDAAFGIEQPAVIDFKIGQVTHDPEASSAKIARQLAKYPPVELIGFQLLGMRVYSEQQQQQFAHYDKIFGRALAQEDLVHGLALYYQFHTSSPQLAAVRQTLRAFESIRRWFAKQTTYHFYSSSLIVIYEARMEQLLRAHIESNNNNTTSADGADENAALVSRMCRIVMADFAHVFPANGALDTNYSFGLDNLIEHLHMILDANYRFKDVRPPADLIQSTNDATGAQ